LQCVILLCGAGASTTKVSPKGQTAKDYAARAGKKEIVEFFENGN
jgi:hypothetical protein